MGFCNVVNIWCYNQHNYQENQCKWKLFIEPSKEHSTTVKLISIIISRVGGLINLCTFFHPPVSNNKLKTTWDFCTVPFLEVLLIFFLISLHRKWKKLIVSIFQNILVLYTTNIIYIKIYSMYILYFICIFLYMSK